MKSAKSQHFLDFFCFNMLVKTLKIGILCLWLQAEKSANVTTVGLTKGRGFESFCSSPSQVQGINFSQEMRQVTSHKNCDFEWLNE